MSLSESELNAKIGGRNAFFENKLKRWKKRWKYCIHQNDDDVQKNLIQHDKFI